MLWLVLGAEFGWLASIGMQVDAQQGVQADAQLALLLNLGVGLMFEVGDRIRVRISTPFVRMSTLGTILRVYRPVADAYTIQFDQVSHPWVMQGCDLERLSAVGLGASVQDVIANE